MSVLRYRLDDLGWYQFEMLIQSVLKAEFGLTVESWGGHHDLGRDAYSPHAIVLQKGGPAEAGPFLFQAKFVQGANAAGADSARHVISATAKESVRISNRTAAGTWDPPRHYFLITNAPLSADLRARVMQLLHERLPESKVTTFSGTDVCDLLDGHPELRRAYPEILGLRDLDQLLSETVNGAVLERSRVAIEETRDLVPVFVPTAAYDKAWKIVEQHSFVVLDGPPEMGKTAIARAIAFSHLLSDWEAIDCRTPDDFFALYRSGEKQVFVGDDAFGRTEYDAALGRAWERDLPRILRRVDKGHRLLLTSRKHILLRAVREMDLTGEARTFPDPAEVIVTADALSVEEKSRILYRHAKSCSEQQRSAIRRVARAVIHDADFTPERIRRIANDVLPSIELSTAKLEDVDRVILESVSNPTERIRKTFRSLTRDHQWALAAVVEADRRPVRDVVRERFFSLTDRPPLADFDVLLEDLLGTFLKQSRFPFPQRRSRTNSWDLIVGDISWIHPSYRDLVISEISGSPALRLQFVSRLSWPGVRLALSEESSTTNLRFPLLPDRESAEALRKRCRELASEGGVDDLLATLTAIGSAWRSAPLPEWLVSPVRELAHLLAETFASRSVTGSEVTAGALKTYVEATSGLLATVPRRTWTQRGRRSPSMWNVNSTPVNCLKSTLLRSGKLSRT